MEAQEKVGTVLMKSFESLKKICSENSTSKLIGILLPRYEKIVDDKIKLKETIPMFTKATCDEYIRE